MNGIPQHHKINIGDGFTQVEIPDKTTYRMNFNT